MKKVTPLLLAILAGILVLTAACTPVESQTEESSTPAQVTPLPTDEPGPVLDSTTTPLPPTEEPKEETPGTMPGEQNMFAPQPGDEDLDRSPVFVEGSSVTETPDDAGGILVSVHLQGYLPTPCNQLRVEIAPVNENNEIHLTVYSLTDPNESCITVLQEYSADLQVGKFPKNSYKIFANEILIGEIVSPEEDGGGEENMVRGPITLQEQGVVYDANRTPPVSVQLMGYLPTPCHIFKAEILPPDSNNQIHLDVFTLVDPSQMCLTVIEEFDETVVLGDYSNGNYTVWVNGIEVGGFEIP